MWAAMSPPPPMLPPSTYSMPGTHTTTEKNQDGSSTVYVHHINHGASAAPQAPPPQMQMPQMFGVPYPMPMPMPTPAPMYSPYPAYPPPHPSSFGCPYHPHQQQQQQHQPRVIVISDEPPKSQPKKEEKKEEKKKEEKKEPPAPIPPPPPPLLVVDKDLESESDGMGPQQFSKFSITSVIMFFVALAFSIVCVIKTYEAFDHYEAGVNTSSDEEYSLNRTVAISTGGASVLAFTIATFCSFYAGMRHRHHGHGDGHCCLDGFIIAGWVIYCIAFINDLIILVLAFDEDNVIYPEVVWSALIVSIFAWMLMFGFSEIARRG